MKIANIVSSLLAVCLLAFAGCKKSDQTETAERYHGVNIDWQKLDTEFAKAAPDVQANLTTVKRFLRYGQFPEALVELDKLSNNASLTEAQKKLVNDLIENTKQAIIKSPPPPGR